MNIDDLFPSKYVKASDLAGLPLTLQIAGVRTEMMNDGTPKAVLHFTNGKPLVLNVTNKNVCKELFGGNTDDWQGKPITLFATTTEFSGRRVDCIRLRAPVMVTTKAKAEPAPVQPDAGRRVPRAVQEPPAYITEPSGLPEQTGPASDDDFPL